MGNMYYLHRWKNLVICCLLSLLPGLSGVPALGQGTGAVPLPLAKPAVDQLGQMEGVPGQDKTMLALGLFLQVIALVAVAIALAGHWMMPKKKKS